MPCQEPRLVSALPVPVGFIRQANNVRVVWLIGFDTQPKITDEPDMKTQNGLARIKTLGTLRRCAFNAHGQPFSIPVGSPQKRSGSHPTVISMNEARPRNSSIDDRTTTELWKGHTINPD